MTVASPGGGPEDRSARLADLADGRRITPMLRQYLDLKQEVPDAILLFRMGDFYETFFEDAETASRALDLTLTSRERLGDLPIPMAGVPHHTWRGYVQRLIEQGHKVAVAEQLEDPKEAKGLVKRGITEIVTPGLVLDPDQLDARAANYLMSLVFSSDAGAGVRRVGLAHMDVSTGEFACTEVDDEAALRAELDRLSPSEILFPESDAELPALAAARGLLQARFAPLPESSFTPRSAEAELRDLLGIRDLSGLGLSELPLAVRAAGALLQYLRQSHIDRLDHVLGLRPYRTSSYLVLDEATRRNLELFRTMSEGRRAGSLLGLLDRATTGMGSRRLRQWIGAPLLDVARIEERLAAVEILVRSPELRDGLQARLALVQDIERINARVTSGRAHARDLLGLRRSLEQAPALDVLLDRSDTRALPFFQPLPDLRELAADVARTLEDDPPLGLKDGGLIRRGVDPDLDELVELSREGKGALARLESDERRRTGIASLKVRYNRVFGYYIEITRANLDAVPSTYIRKQTLANCERYYTPELKEFEQKVLGAEERRCQLEFELFGQLRDRVAARARDLSRLADRLSEIDALLSFSEIAVRQRYVRPSIDDSDTIELVGCRHPVIETMKLGERFVPNDVTLDRKTQQLLVITGPNMAGKSTVMRQVALAVLLAQAGSFVPAERAHVGLVDRVFTRVGASDNLARGQSTFMVEMAETAAILHTATERSLAILDEVGRGTSTWDGLAIAWAVAEHIADRIRCRTMFATHYHELVELALTREHVRNYNIAVSETAGRVIFLRRLKPGGASRSYGIQVARLAGLPEPVIQRARELLSNLESDALNESGRPKIARGHGRGGGAGDDAAGAGAGRPAGDSGPGASARPSPQLSLFADRSSLLKQEILAVDLETLTPLQAMNALAELQKKARG
jgi:DNA mismatch repair protein MutS